MKKAGQTRQLEEAPNQKKSPDAPRDSFAAAPPKALEDAAVVAWLERTNVELRVSSGARLAWHFGGAAKAAWTKRPGAWFADAAVAGDSTALPGSVGLAERLRQRPGLDCPE